MDSNANSKHSNEIRSIQMQIRTIRNHHLKEIWSIRMQIPTIRMAF